MSRLSPELLARYGDRQLPRYTSYPTAPQFRAAAGDADARAWLGSVPSGEPISLYVHIPFCRAMCWYCGCNTSVTRRAEPVARYLDSLRHEIALVAAALPARLPVGHLHFGGGTPTLMAAAEMAALMAELRVAFDFRPAAEVAIEIDPRTLGTEMTAVLGRSGFTRASLGVQSFDPAVQRAINRVQSFEETRGAVNELRAAGVSAINLDLIYGLPHQTVGSCRDTVAQALALAPDRLSVFGYAHVPGFKPHQRKIPSESLPDTPARLAQAEAIAEALTAAGYQAVGLDHFARPGDALAAAARNRQLHRNFQGYTTDRCATMIGLGASAIGRTPAGYLQNASTVPDYQKRVAAGQLAVARQCAVTRDDALRGAIIERIMCDYRVDLPEVCTAFNADPRPLTRSAALDRLAADGIIRRSGATIEVNDNARPLVRAVAAAFDAYLDESAGRHARAV